MQSGLMGHCVSSAIVRSVKLQLSPFAQAVQDVELVHVPDAIVREEEKVHKLPQRVRQLSSVVHEFDPTVMSPVGESSPKEAHA